MRRRGALATLFLLTTACVPHGVEGPAEHVMLIDLSYHHQAEPCEDREEWSPVDVLFSVYPNGSDGNIGITATRVEWVKKGELARRPRGGISDFQASAERRDYVVTSFEDFERLIPTVMEQLGYQRPEFADICVALERPAQRLSFSDVYELHKSMALSGLAPIVLVEEAEP